MELYIYICEHSLLPVVIIFMLFFCEILAYAFTFHNPFIIAMLLLLDFYCSMINIVIL